MLLAYRIALFRLCDAGIKRELLIISRIGFKLLFTFLATFTDSLYIKAESTRSYRRHIIGRKTEYAGHKQSCQALVVVGIVNDLEIVGHNDYFRL